MTQNYQNLSKLTDHQTLASCFHNLPCHRLKIVDLREGLMDEITRQLTPHYEVAEEIARVEAAKKMGIDLVAMEERIIAWRKQNDLVTAQEIALSDCDLLYIVEEVGYRSK